MTDRPYPRKEDFYDHVHGTYNGQAYDAAVRAWEEEQMGPGFTPDAHYWDNGQGTWEDDSHSASSETVSPIATQKKLNKEKEDNTLKKQQAEQKKRIEKRKEEIQKTLEKRKKDPVWQSICSTTPILISKGLKKEARVIIQNYLSQKTK